MAFVEGDAERTFSHLPEVLRIESNSRQCLCHLLHIGSRIQIPQRSVTRNPPLTFLLLLLQLPLLLLLLVPLRLLSLLLEVLLLRLLQLQKLLLRLRLLLLQLMLKLPLELRLPLPELLKLLPYNLWRRHRDNPHRRPERPTWHVS